MQNSIDAQTGVVKINGEEIYYEIAGAGDPLVLIHAGVADSRMWDEQFELFAQHFRVIRYDLRGFGHSNVPMRFSHHDDLAQMLDYFNIQKASLIGNSFGARVALDFSLAYPERVAALVIVSPSVGGNPPSPAVQAFVAEEEAALERGDLDAAAELNVRMWVDGKYRSPDQVKPAIRDLVRAMQRHAFTIPFPGDVDYQDLVPPAIERLQEIQAPTLIFIGSQDLPEYVEMAERLGREIPGAAIRVFPDTAHLLTLEKPDEFNSITLGFLTDIGLT